MAKNKTPDPPAGAPDWMVTYGDIMTLLLCFFVILVSMSEIKQNERFQQVIESLRKTFGGQPGAVRTIQSEAESTNTLIAKLLELELRPHTNKEGDTDDEGIDGTKFRVTNIRDGVEVVIGGTIAFDRYSAELKEEARRLVGITADTVRGYNTKIRIRGHATREPIPVGSAFSNQRDLSYGRASAVAAELERHGVRSQRLVIEAVGDTEPVARQAYTEERRARNRRVEIMVTEDLIEELAGKTQAEDLKEPSDGR